MIATIGKVYIDGERFTTDPKITRSWVARQSLHQGIQGTHTVQDFDRHAKDMFLSLTSDGNFINASFKAVIDGLAAVRGAVYDYTDYTGMTATVKILNFDAQPTFIRDGDLVLYEYTLDLKVMTLTLMDGVAYTGS